MRAAVGPISVALETPHQEEVHVLLKLSDAYATALYPPESNHLVYDDTLAAPTARFLVARLQGRAVGCGALILGPASEAEIKRMFVDPQTRGHGVGRAILDMLEAMARQEKVATLRLETGIKNSEALALYRRSGFRECGPFGEYRPDPLSVFMEKRLAPA